MKLFYDYRFQDCPNTGRSIGSYIVFYSGGPIDHCKYVPGTVYQSGAEIGYNVACTEGMELEHFIMLKK